MNYFAHGIRFLDRPWFLAGTAVPDWLAVADRRVRLRSGSVAPFAAADDAAQAELAAGVLQHLEDDRRFHTSPAFRETSGDLSGLYREALGFRRNLRAGFLGHVTTELLLDGVLIERHPGRLDAYYDALAGVDSGAVQRRVNRMSAAGTDRLAGFIDRFREVRFLADYGAPDRLRHRLNQVLRLVRLAALPRRAERVLREGRDLVAARADALLPPA